MRYALACLLALGLAAPTVAQSVTFDNAFPNLTFTNPTGFFHPGDGSTLVFVTEQDGNLLVFDNDAAVVEPDTFLVLPEEIGSGGERGFVGLAFHPDYATNGYVYTNYTVRSPRRQRISRWTRSATDPRKADPASEVIMYEGDEALENFSGHNGGSIAFGPPEGPSGERYLYMTHGDGGSAGDPTGNGQNLETLLGSIVRLSVDGSGTALDCAEVGIATVPADNPFADGLGGDCDEIYAYGLRNPFRIAFDPVDNWTLWAGDVGQGSREEVDIIEAGANYGWAIMEGAGCFNPPMGCDMSGLTLPIHEFPHTQGRCAIIGGPVYRGALLPDLVGKYIFADYCQSSVWALDYDGQTATVEIIFERILDFGNLSSFGTDADGELYAVSIFNGTIHKFRLTDVANEDNPEARPPALTLTGSNPVRTSTTLRLSTLTDRPASLALFDVLGRRVAMLFEGTLRAGTPQTITVQTDGLAPGVYVARLEAGAITEALTLSVIR